jgi:hypothetical protein
MTGLLTSLSTKKNTTKSFLKILELQEEQLLAHPARNHLKTDCDLLRELWQQGKYQDLFIYSSFVGFGKDKDVLLKWESVIRIRKKSQQ